MNVKFHKKIKPFFQEWEIFAENQSKKNAPTIISKRDHLEEESSEEYQDSQDEQEVDDNDEDNDEDDDNDDDEEEDNEQEVDDNDEDNDDGEEEDNEQEVDDNDEENMDEIQDFNQFMDKMEGDVELDGIQQDYQEREQAEEEEQMTPQLPKNNLEEEQEDPEEIFNNLAYGVNERNMQRVENALIGKKSWQLKGEVRGSQRPINGLLDAEVDFDLGLQAKVVISKELNQKFEEIVRQRILDFAFDDRELPKMNPFRLKEQSQQYADLNFEKDNRGLAGVYEDEYRKTVLGSDPVKGKQDKLKEQISHLFKNICFCIDSMSRNNFTPNNGMLGRNRVVDEQILVDEKIPVFVSTNLVENRKSFKETHEVERAEFKTKSEMTSTEKKSVNRKVKEARHRISLRIKEEQRIKNGISARDGKLLEKNQSKVTKQIKDSKVTLRGEIKGSNFFGTLEKLKKIKQK